MNRRHFLLVLLDCLVPALALAAVFLFKIPVNPGMYFGLILLCPLMHFFMTVLMAHNHGAELQAAHVHVETGNGKK